MPAGFCVTTDAFRLVMATAPGIDDQLERLSRLDPEDRPAIQALSAQIRLAIGEVAISGELAAEITRSVDRLGADAAYAVRSSATAEDLPTASFAGQQDSYLNVVGVSAILENVSRCWASLFTERAVIYRQRNGFDHRKVHMAVVVQQMVFPQAAGVAFTADPVTSSRKIVSIEAVFGLGEALVSGLVNADVYKVRDGQVATRTVAGEQPALTDEQILRLAQLSRRIEAHFGYPQDIEWCLAGDEFQIVQSRPITTLFPIPETGDQGNHVYISVGHQQMMTDAMKPLGLAFWQLTTPRPMAEAGGRLFVDVTQQLGAPGSRAGLMKVVGRSDPLTGDALQTVVDRGDFIPVRPDEESQGPSPFDSAPAPIETDPAIVTGLVERFEASVAALKRDIATKSGPALLDFIGEDLQELRRLMFAPQSFQAIMAGMESTWWLNDHVQEWLGEVNVVDTLAQSLPDNVTSQMGLALLDVADVIRPHPEVVEFLIHVKDENFLDELPALAGGRAARDAIGSYLDKYGMRCVGEIDITKPRWSERPTTLVPMILGNVRNFEPGAAERRFEQGLRDASEKEQELLTRLRDLPEGDQKADEAKRMIDRIRTFSGYREYPKYHMISRYFVYKLALLHDADRLVREGVLSESEDIFYPGSPNSGRCARQQGRR